MGGVLKDRALVTWARSHPKFSNGEKPAKLLCRLKRNNTAFLESMRRSVDERLVSVCKDEQLLWSPPDVYSGDCLLTETYGDSLIPPPPLYLIGTLQFQVAAGSQLHCKCVCVSVCPSFIPSLPLVTDGSMTQAMYDRAAFLTVSELLSLHKTNALFL